MWSKMCSPGRVIALMVVLLIASVQAGLMFLELNETPLLDYSKQMDNQHIMMIGDSLMRYQFLSLVYLLHKGYSVPANDRPNILMEKTYGSWDSFYNGVKKVLEPRDYCDCIIDLHEDHYYIDKKRNISVSFIGYAGLVHPPRGGWMPTDAEPFPVSGQSALHNETRWSYPTLEKTFTNFAAKLKPRPTTLVLNAGHWESDLNDTVRQTAVLTAALQNFDRVFWKTTNYNNEHQPGDYAHDSMCHYPGIECLNLDWTKYLDPVHYTDRVHFMPEVYHDINAQFIYQLTKHRSMRIAPLGATYYGQIVTYKAKFYLVGPVGLLRPFTLPPDTDQNSACRKEIAARKHVQMPRGRLLNHILGEPLTAGICSTLRLADS